MQLLTHEAIQPLLANNKAPAVTIYLPLVTNAAPPNITQNQIRCKNLLHAAITQLEQTKNGTALRKQLERLQSDLLSDPTFWEQQYPGLLLCAREGSNQLFSLPIDTQEFVSVDSDFYIAPILGLLSDQPTYYVLALAQQEPRLFEASMYGLTPTNLVLPHDAFQALGLDEPAQKNESQVSAGGSSLSGGSFNGRGGSNNPKSVDKARYFRIIDEAVTEKIGHNTALILAGEEADMAEYRQLSKHTNILSGSFAGNHKDDNLTTLFNHTYVIAWRELVIPTHRAMVQDYERSKGSDANSVVTDIENLQRAATEGRIATLLASLIQRTADTVQENFNTLPRITFPAADQSRLLNKVATTVYSMRGTVLNLLPSEMPQAGLAVARLHY